MRTWSTLKKLIWLYKGVMKAASWVWKTVTGSLLHITDAIAGDVSALSVAINPVQSGSGDPAPDNVRPISGWTQAKVTRTGKNLAYLEQGTIIITTGADQPSTTRVRTQFIRVEPGKTYICSSENNGWDRRNGCLYDINGQLIKASEYPNSAGRWTCPNNYPNAAFWRVIFSHANTSENCSPSDFWLQVEEAAEATAYEPYSGMTLTIDLDGTRYGGTLDVLTGVLTARPYYASYNGETLVGPWVSSMDKYVAGATPTTGAQVVDLGGTPTTVQLPPAQLSTLAGENNVWADTGDTTMTYMAQGG